jgi:hypothetical protein
MCEKKKRIPSGTLRKQSNYVWHGIKTDIPVPPRHGAVAASLHSVTNFIAKYRRHCDLNMRCVPWKYDAGWKIFGVE